MKKLLMFLLTVAIAGEISSQIVRLDTVRVRNLPLRGRDWLFELGQLAGIRDSAILYWVDRIGAAVKQQIPNISQQNWNNTVTIDSLPGELVMFFYNKYQNLAGGLQREAGQTIYTSIRLVPQLQYLIGVSDASYSREYIEDIKSGKAAGYDN